MTVQEFHLRVEQDLQTITAFHYRDMEPEEIDLEANNQLRKLIQDYAEAHQRGIRLEDTESRLKPIHNLLIEDSRLSTVRNGSVFRASLPSNYLYLVADWSTVLYECRREATVLKVNKYYLVKTGSITYKGATYQTGNTFKTDTVLNFTGTGTFTELTDILSPNRLFRHEDYRVLLNDSNETTDKESPISLLGEKRLSIFTLNKFFVPEVAIDYIRAPKKIVFNDTGDIDLTEEGALQLVEMTVLKLSKIAEQSQQKIANLQNG